MRCPKCGYISFDYLEVCLKCKKNIKAVSDSLQGTVHRVQTPVFLRLDPREDDDSAGDIPVAGAEFEEEYVDDDLEILIEETQDKEIASGADEEDDLRLETEGGVADEEGEDREIEIDFSQFEDSDDEGGFQDEEEPVGKGKEEKSFSLEMPEALADISDLAPPAKMAEQKKEPSPVARESSATPDSDELDFNLALDDLDLSLEPGSPAETELSLDDLDFSETLSPEPPKAKGKNKTGADMDEELNFELDLGGLSIHKDHKR